MTITELARTAANKVIVARRFARTPHADGVRDAEQPPNVAIERAVVVTTAN